VYRHEYIKGGSLYLGASEEDIGQSTHRISSGIVLVLVFLRRNGRAALPSGPGPLVLLGNVFHPKEKYMWILIGTASMVRTPVISDVDLILESRM